MTLSLMMAKKLIKELGKHAQRDGCYECKLLLRSMGFDPDTLQFGSERDTGSAEGLAEFMHQTYASCQEVGLEHSSSVPSGF